MAQPYGQPCDRGIIASEPCPREAGREPDAATKRWTLAACVLASAMAFIDGSALTVALPALARDFDVPVQGVHWVINGYVLALAAMTMTGGALADQHGRRRMLIVGCVLFGITSAACALAPSLPVLIGARILQGVAAAIVTPASLALIGEVFPKDERNRAVGTWAAASALTTAGGPVLGGWLTEVSGWPAIFWINPPLAVLAILMLLRDAPPGPRRDAAFDWIGSVLLAVAMALVAYALSEIAPGEAGTAGGGVTPTLIAVVALAVVATAAFVGWQRRAATPMIPSRVFASPEFTRLNVATLLVYAGLSITFFLVPFEMVDARGLSATAAGLAFLPFTLSLGFLSRFTGAAADRFGARPLLVAGPILAAAGYAAMALLQSAAVVPAIVLPMLISGLGFTLLITPLTAGVMSAVDDADTGLASGLNNTASRLAQLTGVALAAGIAPLAGGYTVALSIAAALSFAGGLVLMGSPRSTRRA